MTTGNLRESVKKAAMGLWSSTPVIAGVLLLVGLLNTLIPKSAYTAVFSKIPILDSFLGSAIGSILAGSPITSYILGGELLQQGVSLVAVTAFIVAWVTVGVVQLPAESMLLGKKFALVRNATAFIMTIVVALATVAIVSMI